MLSVHEVIYFVAPCPTVLTNCVFLLIPLGVVPRGDKRLVYGFSCLQCGFRIIPFLLSYAACLISPQPCS